MQSSATPTRSPLHHDTALGIVECCDDLDALYCLRACCTYLRRVVDEKLEKMSARILSQAQWVCVDGSHRSEQEQSCTWMPCVEKVTTEGPVNLWEQDKYEQCILCGRLCPGTDTPCVVVRPPEGDASSVGHLAKFFSEAVGFLVDGDLSHVPEACRPDYAHNVSTYLGSIMGYRWMARRAPSVLRRINPRHSRSGAGRRGKRGRDMRRRWAATYVLCRRRNDPSWRPPPPPGVVAAARMGDQPCHQ